jgi:hypothetical protein
VADIQAWLQRNQGADLPAASHLRQTLELITADGIITPNEMADLHAAIEAVLPIEARRQAIGFRREADLQVKEEKRAAEREEKEIAHAKKERQRRVARADFVLAGGYHDGRGVHTCRMQQD